MGLSLNFEMRLTVEITYIHTRTQARTHCRVSEAVANCGGTPYRQFKTNCFYCDLFRKFIILLVKSNFLEQLKKYYTLKRIGYNMDIMRPIACLDFHPIIVGSYGFLLNAHRRVGFKWIGSADTMMVPT